MSLYKRDAILPEWEPIPWTMAGKSADEQERGFHERALKPLVWHRILFDAFPAEGLFGHARDWFIGKDLICFATFEGEDLLLIQNSWHGFPDPPEWGLATRPSNIPGQPWTMWGHFPDLPPAWRVPKDETDA